MWGQISCVGPCGVLRAAVLKDWTSPEYTDLPRLTTSSCNCEIHTWKLMPSQGFHWETHATKKSLPMRSLGLWSIGQYAQNNLEVQSLWNAALRHHALPTKQTPSQSEKLLTPRPRKAWISSSVQHSTTSWRIKPLHVWQFPHDHFPLPKTWFFGHPSTGSKHVCKTAVVPGCIVRVWATSQTASPALWPGSPTRAASVPRGSLSDTCPLQHRCIFQIQQIAHLSTATW